MIYCLTGAEPIGAVRFGQSQEDVRHRQEIENKEMSKEEEKLRSEVTPFWNPHIWTIWSLSRTPLTARTSEQISSKDLQDSNFVDIRGCCN